MAEPRFDPGGFYEFDLAEGAVRARGEARVLVLSDTVVAPLVSAAVANGDLTPIRRLGAHMGEHVLRSLGGSPAEAAPEIVLGHAASVLALYGWGRLSLERWGDAMIALVTGHPVLDEDRLAMAALLGGVFSSLAGRDVACVPIANDRFVVVEPSIAETVWAWSKGGDSVAAIVDRLAEGA